MRAEISNLNKGRLGRRTSKAKFEKYKLIGNPSKLTEPLHTRLI